MPFLFQGFVWSVGHGQRRRGAIVPYGGNYDADLNFQLDEFSRGQIGARRIEVVARNPVPLSLPQIYQGDDLRIAKRIANLPGKVVVAVADSGVDYNSPAIASKLAQGGWDFVEEDDRPYDFSRAAFWGFRITHGTAVASIAAGDGEHVAVLPFRMIGQRNGPPNADDTEVLQRVIQRAREHHARIINLSFGTYFLQVEDNPEKNREQEASLAKNQKILCGQFRYSLCFCGWQ